MAPAKPRQLRPFDPQALLDAQRRNFDAFASAGEIVAAGMRSYAERQAALMQEGMRGLWGELQAGGAGPKSSATAAVAAATAAPAEQAERMRAAFERVVAQVQELGQLLIKVQTEALGVLNACVVRNLETLGTAAPDLADLQDRAKAAFEAANRETTAVVDEMKQRMAALEAETRGAAAPPPAPPPPRATAAPAGETSPPATASPAAKPPAAKPPAAGAAAKPAARKLARTAAAPRTRRGPAKPPT